MSFREAIQEGVGEEVEGGGGGGVRGGGGPWGGLARAGAEGRLPGRAGSQARRALDGGGRQRPDESCDPRRQPRDRLRAQAALRPQGRGGCRRRGARADRE